MDDLIELRLKSEALARHGLPDIAYPVPKAQSVSLLTEHGELPLTVLFHGLQQRAREGGSDWQKLEPAMSRLAELSAPHDDRTVIPVDGDHWWLEIGPVDLTSEIVTIQRADMLLAAISKREDGRLRVAVYRPLDAKSAGYLTGLGMNPDPEHGVAMRENNWEYALDSASTNGSYYAAERGEAYLSYWQKGLGVSWDDTQLPEWRKQLDCSARPASHVVTELNIHCATGDADTPSLDPGSADSEEGSAVAPRTWSPKRQQRRTVQDRFRGCLLGGAVGDALGAPVEFMKRHEILRKFGSRGITQYAPAYGGIGTITDDTQMTLFTAEGLLRAWVRGCFKGITTYPGVTAHAYLRWLQTQGEHPNCPLDFGTDEHGWLFSHRALHHRRAPGITCLSALEQMKSLGEPARNNSKGCGGVMRVAPVGLFGWTLRKQASPTEIFELGRETAALTHGHPSGTLTAGVLAVLVAGLTDGATLREVLDCGKGILSAYEDHYEALRALEAAEELATSGVAHEVAIERLGQGWVAEEALAIGVYCALVARNFKHGVILAVNHDGDSDSTGSIAGSLLGAMHGAKKIPESWLSSLELHEVIVEMADDLMSFKDWDIGEGSESTELSQQIWKKYPGF